jgi:hypothetical protein
MRWKNVGSVLVPDHLGMMLEVSRNTRSGLAKVVEARPSHVMGVRKDVLPQLSTFLDVEYHMGL